MTDAAAPADPSLFDIRAAFEPRPQGYDVTQTLFYEAPSDDPAHLEVWCYTDRLSYAPGEEVRFHASASVDEISIEVVRDGLSPATVHRQDAIASARQTLPEDFYERGCGWPVSHAWRLPDDLPTGFYIVLTRARNAAGAQREQEHGFFVRRAAGADRAPMLLVAATCSWMAYNDWGGINNYMGHKPPEGFTFAPRLHVERPMARGLVWLPPGAPRKPHAEAVPIDGITRYPPIEFAAARGFSKWYANAGWASYEGPFCKWAERNGYAMDYATQHDLDADPALLDGYACVVFVGHDEYWSWTMRDSVDRYVEAGGRVARFAGNFAWQIRLEDEGRVQVCYKEKADREDPVAKTEPTRMTTLWEHPAVGRPGATTFGLNAAYGVYAGVGGHVPRGPGGFTVYRPEHWSFAATDLYYGDVFGGSARIFGYEVDGLDYTFTDGLPYPTHRDGAPQSVSILAMGLASNTEDVRGRKGSLSYYGDAAPALAWIRYGDTSAKSVAAAARGSGMMVCFTRGAGEVFHAGSSEWVAGLQAREPMTETITRNVLDRYAAKA